MKKNILIFGSLVTIGLTVLWYLNIITEPVAAIGAAVLTFLGYLFAGNDNDKTKKIKQTHSGSGDNVGGDKIINK